jgi:hypothetical protein
LHQTVRDCQGTKLPMKCHLCIIPCGVSCQEPEGRKEGMTEGWKEVRTEGRNEGNGKTVCTVEEVHVQITEAMLSEVWLVYYVPRIYSTFSELNMSTTQFLQFSLFISIYLLTTRTFSCQIISNAVTGTTQRHRIPAKSPFLAYY